MLFHLMSMYMSQSDLLLPVSGELWMVGWVDVVPLDVNVHVPVGPTVTCKWLTVDGRLGRCCST